MYTCEFLVTAVLLFYLVLGATSLGEHKRRLLRKHEWILLTPNF